MSDNLALRLARLSAPHLDLDDAETFLEMLSGRGYRLVASDAPGEMSALARDLARRLPDIRTGRALTAIERMNLRIAKPYQVVNVMA